MKKISFAELRGYVGVDTKEERVPSTKKIFESGTKPVIRGRFGRVSSVVIRKGSNVLFSLTDEAVYEEVMTFPTGGYLAGNDMSMRSREICVRVSDEICFSAVDDGRSLCVEGGGVLIPNGLWVPEMRNWSDETGDIAGVWALPVLTTEMSEADYEKLKEIMEEFSEIAVFVDGNVIYGSGGYDTVFALCQCSDYEYASVKGSVHMPQSELDALEWNVRLSMKGLDRISKNTSNKKNEVPLPSGDGDVDMSEYVFREYYSMKQIKDDAWELLLSLEEEEKRLLLMYFFEDKSQKEISTELDIARETVSRRISRILNKIRGK